MMKKDDLLENNLAQKIIFECLFNETKCECHHGLQVK